MIIFFLILIILTILIFSILYYFIKKHLKDRADYTVFLFGKGINHNIYLNLYDFFSQWSVTRRYIKNITRSIQIYSASEYQDISAKVMKLVLKIWLTDVTLLILIYLRNPSLFTFFLLLMYLLIINNQIIIMVLDKGNINLLKQLDYYLENVRQHFQIHGMIDEAIFDSLNQLENPMKSQGLKIYEILNAADIQEETVKYNENTPNRFLKLFLSLCVMMVSYGDKKINDNSLFLTNLKYLRQEVNIEILNRERMNHMFSGLILVTLTPALFLKTIEGWAVSSLSEMEGYYKSLYGILTLTAILLITYASYILINRLKENIEYEKKTPVILEILSNNSYINHLLIPVLNKNYGRTERMKVLLLKTGEPYTCLQMFIKQILYGFLGFILCIFLSVFIHWNNKEQLLTNYNQLDYLNSNISKSQIIMIKDAIQKYVFLHKGNQVEPAEIEEKIREEGLVRNKQYVSLTVREIINRLEKYKNEYYHWYEMLISLMMTAMFYQIPYLNLLLIRKLREKNMEDEIIQFHMIILMLMYIDRITIEIILEWLENFAVIFKGSLEQLRNEIQNGEMEILEEIKLKETYHPFIKIIENLQISDRIGIEKAFDEIRMDRLNYQEKRKLDNEINMKDKASLGKAIAFIPFIITIGLYLILPFVVKGLSTFMGYMEQMNSAA